MAEEEVNNRFKRNMSLIHNFCLTLCIILLTIRNNSAVSGLNAEGDVYNKPSTASYVVENSTSTRMRATTSDVSKVAEINNNSFNALPPNNVSVSTDIMNEGTTKNGFVFQTNKSESSTSFQSPLSTTSVVMTTGISTSEVNIINRDKNNVWKFLDYMNKNVDDKYYYDYPTIFPMEIEHTEESPGQIDVVHEFFSNNWLWVFLILLGIILLFCSFGMIIQFYCHKFYRAYNRKKKRKRNEKTSKLQQNKGSSSTVSEVAIDINSSEEQNSNKSNEADAAKSFEDAQTSKYPEPNKVTTIFIESPILQTQKFEVHRTLSIEETPSILSRNAEDPSITCMLDSPITSSQAVNQPVTNQPNKQPSVSCVINPLMPDYAPCLQQPFYSTLEPVRVYPLGIPNKTDSKIESTKKSMKNGRLLDSKYTPLSTDHPRRRQKRRKKRKDFPVRPPKPSQYRIPSCEENMQENKNRQKKEENKISSHTMKTRQNRKKPDKSLKTNYDETKHKSLSRGEANHRKKRNTELTRLKELERQEKLLRRIIQGLSEAEMLHNKLERTRKWTKEQKTQQLEGTRHTNKRMQNANAVDNSNKPHCSSSKKDRPPRYEDVMSEIGSLQNESKAQKK